MNYGLPYKGSKNKIAEWVVDVLPEADTLVDLFAGGCAVTHCAMLSEKYNNYIINDIEGGIVQLFVDAVNGKYKDETRWISREDFKLLKDKDPYIRYCWSFGNNGNGYLYGTELEPYKKALHEMIFAKTPHETRLAWRTVAREFAKLLPKYGCGTSLERLESLESLESLQSLESLERLQSLERLERLQSLESYSLDYRKVPIPENAVIYCDIPYKNTEKYSINFNHDEFYDWCTKQTVPVYIYPNTICPKIDLKLWRKEKKLAPTVQQTIQEKR